jgi:hypothetical protein
MFRDLIALAGQADAGFSPRLHQRELFDVSSLEKVTHVHVEAVGTVIDLGNSQIDQFDKRRGRLLWMTHPYTPPRALMPAGAIWL